MILYVRNKRRRPSRRCLLSMNDQATLCGTPDKPGALTIKTDRVIDCPECLAATRPEGSEDRPHGT